MISRHPFLYLVLIQAFAKPCIDAANILGLYSSPTFSHLIVHMSVVKALADAGHNLTVVTALSPEIEPHENITNVLIPPNPSTLKIYNEVLAEFVAEEFSMSSHIYKVLKSSQKLVDTHYEFAVHPKLKAIYDTPDTHFDLVILGYYFNDFQLGIAAKLNVPVIVDWVGVPIEMMDDIVGNTNDPAYVPHLNMVRPAGERTMGFGQRVKNYLLWLIFKVCNPILKHYMERYYKLAFGNDSKLPSYQEMRKRISLVFYNYHSHSEGPVRPIVPASIEIGGIQIKEQPDPLPTDIADFLDNASAGAIFFSLGTHIHSYLIRPDIVATIFKVFSSLPQRIIWKWDRMDNLPGNSSNILYRPWLPQDDLLAHPNMKLFITHAGKGSIAESQFHGVPMLGVPIWCDQPGNADAMAAAGLGVTLDFLKITEESLRAGIREVLDNDTYRENVQRFSKMYRDRPMTARQSVVYWTDYVLRYKGAYHLQSPWVYMSLMERYNLDVQAALWLVLVSALFVLSYVVRNVRLVISYQRYLLSRFKTGKFPITISVQREKGKLKTN
ncbi:UDP-glucuronosyltransferase [Scaptodrosophila lebanonensis]|uniref:UDP-glucuronosyltransferase n=1 Tax=Drosophila lebanonensis TaxID=7225 RepID=A0A6J2U9F9_DROLE|nr:UDP-glucuronosyltransferase [Scaptodrosophila lebanonensis]